MYVRVCVFTRLQLTQLREITDNSGDEKKSRRRSSDFSKNQTRIFNVLFPRLSFKLPDVWNATEKPEYEWRAGGRGEVEKWLTYYIRTSRRPTGANLQSCFHRHSSATHHKWAINIAALANPRKWAVCMRLAINTANAQINPVWGNKKRSPFEPMIINKGKSRRATSEIM